MKMKLVKIKTSKGERKIGLGQPVFIIAEASSNHGGILARAKKMIDAAAEAGADAVKFQLFKAEKIAADTEDPRTIVRVAEKSVFVDHDTKLIDIYRKNELPREWVPHLAKHASQKGIIFLATPFDEEAVDLLESVDSPAYKVASCEMLDVPLLRKMAKTKKPIIISTGMADIAEIHQAINILKKAGNNKIILLHCRSIYPAPASTIGLKAIDKMYKVFNLPVGFSDHTLGIHIPIAAVAREACVIEKHFILDDGVETIDAKFSLTPAELKKMVHSIREVELALGTENKKPTKVEIKERVQARRSLWVVKDTKIGEKITVKNVQSLRPCIGLSPVFYDKVMGSKAAHNLKAGSPLSWKDLR
ncbi:MAG: pseudaminic acid synthase [Candidatus Staskawiczbacteria bacterium]|nr:pseudaminic acid synthase [Candidatus Staskawiczbacteria bacterium]